MYAQPCFLVRQELLFHATIYDTVISLVDSGFDIVMNFADVDEFLQQLWLKVGDTQLQILAMIK